MYPQRGTSSHSLMPRRHPCMPRHRSKSRHHIHEGQAPQGYRSRPFGPCSRAPPAGLWARDRPGGHEGPGSQCRPWVLVALEARTNPGNHCGRSCRWARPIQACQVGHESRAHPSVLARPAAQAVLAGQDCQRFRRLQSCPCGPADLERPWHPSSPSYHAALWLREGPQPR